MTRCRDCALYDLDAVKDKAGRVRSGWTAKCRWLSTEDYPLSALSNGYRPVVGYMEPNQGDGCPCFIERTGHDR
jgi:hypothetical protein